MIQQLLADAGSVDVPRDLSLFTIQAVVPIGADAFGIIGGTANVDGTFHAVDNECPHFGGPMGLGKLDGGNLSCPWHGWTFDVTSGENVHSPQLALKCFRVKVEGDQVLVEV